jgi:PAS domain S-box-containing protein
VNTDIEDRKRAEEALRASERNLKQIINTLPTTAWVTDPNGYVEFLSDRWLNYAGITAEQGAGFGWGTVIHPEDAPALFAYWHSCLEAGTPVDTEARMRRFDGEYRWFLFRASPMRDEQGAILKWYGTNIDIEDRKRADEALLASEHNLALIINTIPIAAWSARADGFTDFLNETYLNYAGDTSTQIEGWGWRDLVHPDDVNSLDAYWRSCIETGAPGSAEARMRRYDGVYHWFLLLANALRDKSGAVIKWYGATIDIEDRKRAESLLAGEKQLLAMVAQGQLLDDVLNALCQIVERNSRSSLCSILSIEQADSRFRYGAGPSLPSVVRVALDGLIIDRAHSPCGLAAESKTQVVAADLETDPRWQASPWPKLLVGHGLRACWSTPILSSEERVIGMFTLYQREPATPTAIDEDLIRQFAHVASIAIERSQSDAELRRTDEALSRTRSELTQMARVTTLGALTASIAHEVNQPLAGVVTNSSICLRMLGADPPDVEGALESTRRTIRDGNLASEVIRRLRELFARNQPKMEPVDLNDAAREVLTLSLSELQDRRIVVHTDFADDLPVVSADRIQLQQVILNLVRNAADAMSELDNRPRDLTVSTAAEEGLVSLFVRDVGPGIEPMHLQRLFDAFYTTKADGMGVGLSISQSIIDGHEGRLWTVPNDGPGVTFAFSIPSRRALVNGSPPLDCAGSHPRG